MDAHKPAALRRKYSAALMSDHKWKKFYQVMAEHGRELCGIEYHFTDSDEVLTGAAPTRTQVWDTAIDDPARGAGGPVDYRLIESLAIPRVFRYRQYESGPLVEKRQEIEAFLAALKKIGEFPIAVTSDYLILEAYRKS